MFRTITSRLGSFQRDEKGTVAVMIGLTIAPLCLFTGLAIDSARLYNAERRLGAVIDAAALAGGKVLQDGRASDTEVIAVAKRYFDENMGGEGRVTDFSVSVDRGSNAVTVEAATQVSTLFWGVSNSRQRTVNIPRMGIAKFDQKDIELGLQLDVTGSMDELAGDGERKIVHLKRSVGTLLDILMPDAGTTNTVRIGLAPFAAGVNAGPYALAVSGGRAANGCVYERRRLADQTSDSAPIDDLALKARVDLGAPQGCSNAEVVALTDKKEVLRREVNSWSPNGTTAGHLGAAWAWYLVSPTWKGVWPSQSRPAEYSDKGTQKAIVLMTDGDYNTVGGVYGGNVSPQATQSKRFTQDICNAVRGANVTVYTIGFRVSAAVDAELLACAGAGKTAGGDRSKAFKVENGVALESAFRAIAEELKNLRLAG